MSKKISDKRAKRRLNYFIALSFDKECDENSQRVAAEVINISETGACIITDKEIEIGSTVYLRNVLNKPFQKLLAEAKVVWNKKENSHIVHGLKYHSITGDPNYMQILKGLFTSFEPRFNLLKIILLIGVPIIPLLALTLNYLYPDRMGGNVFLGFIFFIVLERVWETFFTSKEFNTSSSSGDWTITAVSFYYILMLILMTIEFFSLEKSKPLNLTLCGIGILLFSFFLRAWGMISLGDQWAIHATNSNKKLSGEIKLVIKGPYQYVRHPIYLGVILELIAIPLIAQTLFTLTFVLLVNIPLQILRSRLEEINSISIFGSEYLFYMDKVGGIFPKILKG